MTALIAAVIQNTKASKANPTSIRYRTSLESSALTQTEPILVCSAKSLPQSYNRKTMASY